MKLGKLTTEELQRNVMDLIGRRRPEVLMSAALGEDCAAIDFDDTVLVSSDPITAVVEPEKIGALCISVCCNDVAANGGIPVAVTLTLIMPPECGAEDVGVIMRGAEARAKQLNVDIVGGHTEFSDCVVRPVVSGTALGKVKRLIRKSGLAAGDELFVTKQLGLEGTCILADIVKPELTVSEREKLESFNASLDVTAESLALSGLSCVTMMHDVTEGGILGAVKEVCLAAGLGAEIYEELMPIDKLTLRLCRDAGVDPLRLISSGSMLAAVRGSADVAVRALKDKGIAFTRIGSVVSGSVTLNRRGGVRENIDVLPDELYKFSGENK